MPDVRRVSPDSAKALLDAGYTYLDGRTEAEFAAGHPVGAHNVPFMNAGARGMIPNDAFLEVATAIYPKDAKLVIGCRSGQRSMKAAVALVNEGYTDVIDQRAGFEGVRSPFGALVEPGWSPAGFPVETTTPGGSYAELLAKAAKG